MFPWQEYVFLTVYLEGNLKLHFVDKQVFGIPPDLILAEELVNVQSVYLLRVIQLMGRFMVYEADSRRLVSCMNILH